MPEEWPYLFWSIGTAIVCAAAGALYNRIARRMIIQPDIHGAAQG